MYRQLLSILVILLLLPMLIACGKDTPKSQSSPPPQQATRQTSQPAQATSPRIDDEVYDIDGKSRRLDEWIGKQPVVLNFWGTWCGPCRREVPSLVRLYKEYSPKGIEMIGLAVNDRPEKVRTFAQQYGMDWVMLMADKDILMKYRVISGIPQTIFLDKNGTEVKRFIGARPYEVLKQGFDAIM
jgi:thiol-disulfide isomerase/thioredoxin